MSPSTTSRRRCAPGSCFCKGCWAEVRRELERLRRAGADFDPVKRSGERDAPEDPGPRPDEAKKKRQRPVVPIAVVTIIDRDEEMALTELNFQSTLAEALTTLPRPVVRPPVGQVVLEHLAAEMTSNWVEMEAALDIFGNSTARVLTRLADAGMLMSEQRVDLHEDVQLYEHQVYVRATSRAMGTRKQRELRRRAQPAAASRRSLRSSCPRATRSPSATAPTSTSSTSPTPSPPITSTTWAASSRTPRAASSSSAAAVTTGTARSRT